MIEQELVDLIAYWQHRRYWYVPRFKVLNEPMPLIEALSLMTTGASAEWLSALRDKATES
jgi:hypothetical protein